VTEECKLQTAPLTSSDFAAWHSALSGMAAVGLFNSHVLAGASQKHRHMQMVPLDVVWEARMHSGMTDAEFVRFFGSCDYATSGTDA
jgi:ATP adenylyltransferase/5',5'''-P-1,P-4-tetraphosphate phosphorylase II